MAVSAVGENLQARGTGLVRCKEAVDKGIFCKLRRRVKIEERHNLRFMKFDRLRREGKGRRNLLYRLSLCNGLVPCLSPEDSRLQQKRP